METNGSRNEFFVSMLNPSGIPKAGNSFHVLSDTKSRRIKNISKDTTVPQEEHALQEVENQQATANIPISNLNAIMVGLNSSILVGLDSNMGNSIASKSNFVNDIAFNRGLYSGEVKKEKQTDHPPQPHGFGELTFHDDEGRIASKYKGTFMYGLYHGQGELKIFHQYHIEKLGNQRLEDLGPRLGEGDLSAIVDSMKYSEQVETYSGDFKYGLRDGYGKYSYRRERYEGDFKTGLPHGKGFLSYQNGDMTYEGNFDRGLFSGEGRLVYFRVTAKKEEKTEEKGKANEEERNTKKNVEAGTNEDGTKSGMKKAMKGMKKSTVEIGEKAKDSIAETEEKADLPELEQKKGDIPPHKEQVIVQGFWNCLRCDQIVVKSPVLRKRTTQDVLDSVVPIEDLSFRNRFMVRCKKEESLRNRSVVKKDDFWEEDSSKSQEFLYFTGEYLIPKFNYSETEFAFPIIVFDEATQISESQLNEYPAKLRKFPELPLGKKVNSEKVDSTHTGNEGEIEPNKKPGKRSSMTSSIGSSTVASSGGDEILPGDSISSYKTSPARMKDFQDLGKGLLQEVKDTSNIIDMNVVDAARKGVLLRGGAKRRSSTASFRSENLKRLPSIDMTEIESFKSSISANDIQQGLLAISNNIGKAKTTEYEKKMPEDQKNVLSKNDGNNDNGHNASSQPAIPMKKRKSMASTKSQNARDLQSNGIDELLESNEMNFEEHMRAMNELEKEEQKKRKSAQKKPDDSATAAELSPPALEIQKILHIQEKVPGDELPAEDHKGDAIPSSAIAEESKPSTPPFFHRPVKFDEVGQNRGITSKAAALIKAPLKANKRASNSEIEEKKGLKKAKKGAIGTGIAKDYSKTHSGQASGSGNVVSNTNVGKEDDATDPVHATQQEEILEIFREQQAELVKQAELAAMKKTGKIPDQSPEENKSDEIDLFGKNANTPPMKTVRKTPAMKRATAPAEKVQSLVNKKTKKPPLKKAPASAMQKAKSPPKTGKLVKKGKK